MTEQLALEQARGQRCTIDGDERAVRVRACRVQCWSDALFAGAGLALNQDGRVTRRHAPNGIVYPPHGDAVTDQVPVTGDVLVRMQPFHFVLQPLVLGRTGYAEAE